MPDLRMRLAPEYRDLYDQIMKLAASPTREELLDNVLCRADPPRARFPRAYRGEYDRIMGMEPSAAREERLRSLSRSAAGDR